MPVNDELRQAAQALVDAWHTTNYNTTLRCIADLRAALAAQPQPLYEGSRQGMILRAVDDTWPDRVVVYPAVAGSATPTGADDVR